MLLKFKSGSLITLSLVVLVVFLILINGAKAWTGPNNDPPLGNVAAPLSVNCGAGEDLFLVWDGTKFVCNNVSTTVNLIQNYYQSQNINPLSGDLLQTLGNGSDASAFDDGVIIGTTAKSWLNVGGALTAGWLHANSSVGTSSIAGNLSVDGATKLNTVAASSLMIGDADANWQGWIMNLDGAKIPVWQGQSNFNTDFPRGALSNGAYILANQNSNWANLTFVSLNNLGQQYEVAYDGSVNTLYFSGESLVVSEGSFVAGQAEFRDNVTLSGGTNGKIQQLNLGGGGEYLYSDRDVNSSNKWSINLATAGVDRLTINEGGNVGIGTNLPTARLEVAGQIKITGGNPGANKVLTSDADGLASWKEWLVGQGGNLTLGTSTLLDVLKSGADASAFSQAVNIGDVSHPANFYVNGGEIKAKYLHATDAIGVSSFAGKVGVGTINPNNTIEVVDLINFDNTNRNTKLGYQAGKNMIAVGENNTMVGYQAGYSSVSGLSSLAKNNTVIGYQALYSNTTGYDNAATGYQALYLNTDGFFDTATGYQALYSNVHGTYNTGVGNQALYSNRYSHYNTALGNQALYTTTGERNVAIGYSAGKYETGGNSFYVDDRDRSNTSGDKAGALLYGTFADDAASQALVVNAKLTVNGTIKIIDGNQGSNKVLTSDANGLASWQNPATITYATPTLAQILAKGADASSVTSTVSLGGNLSTKGVAATGVVVTGGLTTTGNIGVGTANPAYNLDVNGNLNVAAGKAYKYNGANVILADTAKVNYFFAGAGNATMTGTGNLGSGGNALFSNTDGTNNTAYGLSTLVANSSGADNTAIGKLALYNNLDGNDNTAIGSSALSANTSGKENTALGSDTLVANTSGSYNIALGSLALQFYTGNYNIAIGYKAAIQADGLTNAIAIGKNARVDTSNSMVLGGIGNDKVNVGIGVTNPTQRLVVDGAIKLVATSTATDSQGNKYCSAAKAGSIVYEDVDPGSVGTAAHFWGCTRTGTNTYQWVRLDFVN